MMRRGSTLAIGAALIFAANGIALSGVVFNRWGEPESRLTLSQRELSRPWRGLDHKENSGLSLMLEWRVLTRAGEPYYFHESRGGSPYWLDAKRMAELGFDVAFVPGDSRQNARYADQPEREVLVVLELGGAAWRQALERGRQHLAQQVARLKATPEAKDAIAAERQARESLARLERDGSRLYAIDVGPDVSALRAKYPDRGRFMILKAKLRPTITYLDRTQVPTGFLEPLSAREINVPHALRAAFEDVSDSEGGSRPTMPAFNATVAVGQRLEPWIESASRP